MYYIWNIMSVDLVDIVRNHFVDISEELKDAFLYLDSAFNDIIDATVGLSFLFDLGIKGIDIIRNVKRYTLFDILK